MRNKNIIYCDFDGTVTKEDSVNKFLATFANKEWLDVEEQWMQGKIGSRECLSKQIGLLPPLPKQKLMEYVDSIEIDEYFAEFYGFLKRHKMDLVILSDGFDFFIEKTLEKHNLEGIKYFANSLSVENDRLSLEFGYCNPDCKNSSGVCKCERTQSKDFCYIGDGLSDACVARKAGTLFAKNNLQKYCEQEKIKYTSFENFGDILSCFSKKIVNFKGNEDSLLYFPGKRRFECNI